MMITALGFLGGGWKCLTFVKVQNQLLSGRKMYINIEGKGIVVSNNCWCQGDVSDAFKDLMPDNATWATKEEFDKAPVVGYIIEGIGLVFTDREGHKANA